jgi:hypothetical protein
MAEARVLIAVDDSTASRRAVMYVAKLVRRRRGLWLCVVHVLPPWRSELLDFPSFVGSSVVTVGFCFDLSSAGTDKTCSEV